MKLFTLTLLCMLFVGANFTVSASGLKDCPKNVEAFYHNCKAANILVGAGGKCPHAYAETYSGEFQNNKYHGQGLLSAASAEIEGSFRACWPTIAEYRSARGLYYSGQWVRQKPHGKGEIRWPHGSTYKGEVASWMRNGYGVMQYGGPEEKGGHYPSDLQNTKRDYTYIGQWKNDKRHGKGTLFDNDGKVKRTGTWTNGKFGAHK